MRRFYDGYFGKSVKLIAVFALLIFAGCHSRPDPLADDIAPLPRQVDGASDAMKIALQTRLTKEGVKVLTIGQDYLISIPATSLFATQSPKLTWNSYQILNDVACYLQQFRKTTVNVTAFSSKYVSRLREQALTQARAHVVADYLWSQGIDSRFIFTQGLGSDKPIVAFTPLGDGSPNSRIEITFRNAVA